MVLFRELLSTKGQRSLLHGVHKNNKSGLLRWVSTLTNVFLTSYLRLSKTKFRTTNFINNIFTFVIFSCKCVNKKFKPSSIVTGWEITSDSESKFIKLLIHKTSQVHLKTSSSNKTILNSDEC